MTKHVDVDRTARAKIVDCHVHVGGAFGALTALKPTLRETGVTGVILVQPFSTGDHRQLFIDAADPMVEGVVVRPQPSDMGIDHLLSSSMVAAPVFGARVSARAIVEHTSFVLGVFEAAALNNLTVSIHNVAEVIRTDELDRVLRTFPSVGVRLEHLGGCRLEGHPRDSLEFSMLMKVAAKFDQATTTLSGFFHNAGPYPYADAKPFVRDALSAFGPERIAWSGDINRSNLGRADYVKDLEFARSALGSGCSAQVLSSPLSGKCVL